jgi:hypothetical protein
VWAGPLPDTQVRVVDPDTGAELPVGRAGAAGGKVRPISPDWIRTTDIASIDTDGFVTLHGRADGAINRGGFKILPEIVRRVLISHPAVRDACVVGVPDKRLGQVPFAADRDHSWHARSVRGRTQGPCAPGVCPLYTPSLSISPSWRETPRARTTVRRSERCSLGLPVSALTTDARWKQIRCRAPACLRT